MIQHEVEVVDPNRCPICHEVGEYLESAPHRTGAVHYRWWCRNDECTTLTYGMGIRQ